MLVLVLVHVLLLLLLTHKLLLRTEMNRLIMNHVMAHGWSMSLSVHGLHALGLRIHLLRSIVRVLISRHG